MSATAKEAYEVLSAASECLEDVLLGYVRAAAENDPDQWAAVLARLEARRSAREEPTQ